MEYFDINKMKAMGKRIQETRKHKKLTQAQLAERLGISVDQMSNIENGKSACKPDYIYQLVQILEVSSDYLLFGKQTEIVFKDNIDLKIMQIVSRASEVEKDKIYRIIHVILEA